MLFIGTRRTAVNRKLVVFIYETPLAGYGRQTVFLLELYETKQIYIKGQKNARISVSIFCGLLVIVLWTLTRVLITKDTGY